MREEAFLVTDAPSMMISNHLDVMAVLRDRNMAPLRFESGHGGQYFSQVVESSVVDLWGKDHFDRKRLLSSIFGPENLLEIEKAAIRPGVIEPLQRLRDQTSSTSDQPRADLMIIARRSAMRMAMTLIGVTSVNADDEIDLLDNDFRLMERGGRAKFVDDPATAVKDGLAARKRILRSYVDPVWKKRKPIADSILKGDTDRSALPNDLITLMLLNPDHYARYSGSRDGEIALSLIAAIGSSVNAVCGLMCDLLAWLKKHPEDRTLINDPKFLHRSIAESARKHQTSNLFRTAMQDIVLPSGSEVSEGTVIIIDRSAANQSIIDEEDTGYPSDTFNPLRECHRGHVQQGFAFGGGPHVCAGRALMMGDRSRRDGQIRQGFSANMVTVLFAAGAEAIPDHPPTLDKDMTGRETFSTCPIQFNCLDDFESRLPKVLQS